ncbi:MAG: 1-deoxy-D-xylulose-5-phosphate synthase [Planctomycetes bacterium]|nr:1-deoxy-D-xylulose-5-phosphate synthase [Planctomycetota bacterium]
MPPILDTINSPADLKRVPREQLPALAEEIRQEILRVVTQNGGHMGSNLGAVELSIALHYVFESPKDQIIWDVSHQIYTHKLLTGRRTRFETLRQAGGLSGFSNKTESPHDSFTWAHAGTAISTALGMVCGDDLLHRDRRVVAVAGDGSLTCGVAFEGLNQAGALKRNLLVVLNDNSMSIAKTVGAMSNYLHKIRTLPLYAEVKREAHALAEKLPVVGPHLASIEEHLRNTIRANWGGYIFEELGFYYLGPVDGHDVNGLIDHLRELKTLNKPAMLHIVTQKGKGHPNADSDPFCVHAAAPGKSVPASPKIPSPPERKTLEPDKVTKVIASPKKSYTQVFGHAICEVARKNPRVIAITAAMPDGTGLLDFAREFPNRFFDVGICEQHAVALSGGLATAGARPVAAIYSTFLQRGFDQIFHEVCLQDLPVVFGLDRAGLVGNDGPTHHGLCDLAYLRAFPGIVLAAPKDAAELHAMLEWAVTFNRSVALRWPRATAPAALTPEMSPVALGKSETLREGRDGALFAYGAMVEHALQAAGHLATEGRQVAVINARFAKPVDEEALRRLLDEQPFVTTIEDHSLWGGFGSAVLETANMLGLDANRIRRLGVPDRFIEHATREQQLAAVGLDAAGIAASVRRWQDESSRVPVDPARV